MLNNAYLVKALELRGWIHYQTEREELVVAQLEWKEHNVHAMMYDEQYVICILSCTDLHTNYFPRLSALTYQVGPPKVRIATLSEA